MSGQRRMTASSGGGNGKARRAIDRPPVFKGWHSSDPEEIEAALGRIEKTAGAGGINRATSRMIMRQIENAARPNPNPGVGVGDPAEFTVRCCPDGAVQRTRLLP